MMRAENRIENIAKWHLEDIRSKPVCFTNAKLRVLVFVNIKYSAHQRLLAYIDLLQRRYRKNGLRIAGVVASRPNTNALWEKTERHSFPIIWDQGLTLHKHFQITGCCGGLVLMDSKDNVLFRESLLVSSEDLRQLVEKNLLGTIAYDFQPVTNRFFTLHQKSPSLPLTRPSDAKHSDLLSLNKKTLIVTVFSSFCNSCHSGQRVQTLKRLKKRFQSEKNDCGVILLASDKTTRDEVEESIQGTGISFDCYLCPDIFSDEERYIQNPAYITNPLTIVLDENKIVQYVELPGTLENALAEEIAALIRMR